VILSRLSRTEAVITKVFCGIEKVMIIKVSLYCGIIRNCWILLFVDIMGQLNWHEIKKTVNIIMFKEMFMTLVLWNLQI